MHRPIKPGFAKEALEARYDVTAFEEDSWHCYSAMQTAALLKLEFTRIPECNLLLNAGSGVYSIDIPYGREIRVDLFHKPLAGSQSAVCADVQMLPFRSRTFSAVVCVGEVLGYCDPAAAIEELARVLSVGGLLVCDFESSRGIRHWLRDQFGRAADLVTSDYNGTTEHTWIYSPEYISTILKYNRLSIKKAIGTHFWSALGRRLGMSAEKGLRLQGLCQKVPFPPIWGEVVTFVAEKL